MAPATIATSRSTTDGNALVIATTALAPMAWGTTYLVTTELLPEGHPLYAALWRCLPAAVLTLLILRRWPQGHWWLRAAVLGTLNIGAFFPLLFVAAATLPGGVAATLGATQPLLVAGLSVLILRERPTGWRVGWAVAGVLGVALVVLGPDAGLDVTGVVAGLLGTAAMGLGVTLTKTWGRPAGVGPGAFAAWQLTAGGLVLLPVTVAVERVPPAVDVGGLAGYLWLGTVGGIGAYTLWFRGIGRLPVTATALLGLLSPLVAAGLGLLLGQTFSPTQLAGFALALTALVAGQHPGPARSPLGPAARRRGDARMDTPPRAD